MRFQITKNGITTELPYTSFVDADGISHSVDVLERWSDADLAAIGVTRSVDAPAAELTFDIRKATRLQQLILNYNQNLLIGYPKTMSGTPETFQMATDTDRTNWLTIMGICEEAIAAGQGAANCALPVRATSNRTYQLTNTATLALVKDIRTWGLTMMGALWTKKDAINAVTDGDVVALNATDITTWPS